MGTSKFILLVHTCKGVSTYSANMAEGKFFVIRSQLNGLVLDVANNTAAPGNPVVMWDFNGGENQLFYEDYVNGCIRSALDDNLVLEVQGDCLALNHFNPHEPIQQWTFDYQPPRYCFIKSCMNGRVLDVKGNDASPGTKVITYTRNDGLTDNQLWYEDRYGCIRSKLSDLAIDTADGVAVTNECMPSIPTQQWVKSESRIVNRMDPTSCLDIKGAKDMTEPS